MLCKIDVVQDGRYAAHRPISIKQHSEIGSIITLRSSLNNWDEAVNYISAMKSHFQRSFFVFFADACCRHLC
jgi:hypothetical protein